ncbi:hypothetical protein J6590_046819 [Homalodisca vitripennis]|nr:hypothetical protein J6590_046819 [Homalodisca vitripennis]
MQRRNAVKANRKRQSRSDTKRQDPFSLAEPALQLETPHHRHGCSPYTCQDVPLHRRHATPRRATPHWQLNQQLL